MESFLLGMMMIPILLVIGPILGVVILVGLVSNPRLTLRRIAHVAATGAALLLLVCSLALIPMPKESAIAWIGPLSGIIAGTACGWLVYLLRPRTRTPIAARGHSPT